MKSKTPIEDRMFIEALQSKDFRKRFRSLLKYICNSWTKIQNWAQSLDDHDALIIMALYDEDLNRNLFGDERYEQLQPLIEGGNDAS